MRWEHTQDETPGHHKAPYMHIYTPSGQYQLANQPSGTQISQTLTQAKDWNKFQTMSFYHSPNEDHMK